MTLGMIARADQGGLGAQTWEFYRNMRPERTLICLVGHQTRGEANLATYTDLDIGEVRWCYLPSPDLETWICGVDHLWSAETWYSPTMAKTARVKGCTTTLHANPEMGVEDCDRLVYATGWRVPEPSVVPFPVSRDVLPYSPVPVARTFFHVLSEAMEDRNGTEIVLQAAQFVKPCRLLMRGKIPRHIDPVSQIGNVTITWLDHEPGLYYQAWERADVLLLPRRYGGLCLPMQEAMIQGLPVLTLDLEPQRRWLPPESLVPARSPRDVRMRGGIIPVFDANPAEYAHYWNRLIDDAQLVHDLSLQAFLQADSISWPRMRGTYDRLFDRDAVSLGFAGAAERDGLVQAVLGGQGLSGAGGRADRRPAMGQGPGGNLAR